MFFEELVGIAGGGSAAGWGGVIGDGRVGASTGGVGVAKGGVVDGVVEGLEGVV